MKFNLDIRPSFMAFALIIAVLVGVLIGKTTEKTILYHESDYQNFDDFSEIDDFSELDFNNTYKPDPITNIETEFNYPNALVSGILTFGIIIVLIGIKKEDKS